MRARALLLAGCLGALVAGVHLAELGIRPAGALDVRGAAFPLYAPDGSQTDPQYTFRSRGSATGMYAGDSACSDDQLKFVAGGDKLLTISKASGGTTCGGVLFTDPDVAYQVAVHKSGTVRTPFGDYVRFFVRDDTNVTGTATNDCIFGAKLDDGTSVTITVLKTDGAC